LTVQNSLIGDNRGIDLPESPVGSPDANGNLVGGPVGGVIDPRLGPLANNGGPTFTHALLPGSPAIDAGDPLAAGGSDDLPQFDQRGAPFSRTAGRRIDMGAFESQIAPVDFNHDDQLRCGDADALGAAIVEGMNPPQFDLTADRIVDQADLDVWLALAGLENLPSHEAYLPGDTDLNGRVDASDLNVVGQNWLQDVTGWCSADFNTDGQVDARDLNLLALNWHQDVSGEVAAASHARAPRAPLANASVLPDRHSSGLRALTESRRTPRTVEGSLPERLSVVRQRLIGDNSETTLSQVSLGSPPANGNLVDSPAGEIIDRHRAHDRIDHSTQSRSLWTELVDDLLGR
jgi:hypothetical protein